MPSGRNSLASVDGAVMPASEAVIPATDDGLLRGDGAFEVVRIYGGRPFALDEHLDRLERSGTCLRLTVDRPAIIADVRALLSSARDVDPTQGDHAALRIVITRGGRRLLLGECLPQMPARVRLATVTYAPTRILDGVKSLSYAANVLATRVAQERGFDEALLVTPHGRVLEAPTSSFFWVSDGQLLTPPLSDHILASITRNLVLEVGPAREQVCTREDLERAEEAFLASTTREVQPVAAIDDRIMPRAGSVTARVAASLTRRIQDGLSTL